MTQSAMTQSTIRPIGYLFYEGEKDAIEILTPMKWITEQHAL